MGDKYLIETSLKEKKIYLSLLAFRGFSPWLTSHYWKPTGGWWDDRTAWQFEGEVDQRRHLGASTKKRDCGLEPSACWTIPSTFRVDSPPVVASYL